MPRLNRTALLLLTGLLRTMGPSWAQSSVLAEGQWYKVAVEKDGMYEITYDQLRKGGIDPDKLNPVAIQLYTYPTGMLPQSNNEPRSIGLQEIRFYITGASDGRFNRSDKIIFFGQGPDALSYDREKDYFKYENNLYSDRNFYFLTFNQGFGQLVGNQTTLTTGQITATYNDLYLYDTDKINVLQSGRDWFGQDFDANTIATLEWTMDNTVQGSAVKIATRLMASAYDPATFRLRYDNQDIADYPIASIPATPYGLKGRTRSDTAEAAVATGSTHRLRFEYVRSSGNYSIGRLDHILASVKRKLLYNGKSFLFFNTDSRSPECMIEILRTGSLLVWEVTNPVNVANQQIITFGDRFRFSTNASAGVVRRFAVFDSLETLSTPTWIGKVKNQDLSVTTSADFIIVTHPNFLQEAERLATHRRQHNGLRVSVATTEEIFNQFSGGRQDVTAIRDYLRYVFETGGHNLRHVLLFGRGSFDYRNLTTGNTNFVPTYQSRNSLAPLETWSSDDFYAFLESSEGKWGESPAEFHTLDIGVGRIPCATVDEARIAVDKLIAYDTNPATRGSWRKELIFVADDGDNNIHQSQAETLAEDIGMVSPELHIDRLYVDAFEQQQKSFGQLVPDGTETLRRALHDGAAIVNYTGHGSEQLWAAERLLDPDLVRSLRNRNRQPFLVTATCEFGRCDDPGIRSSAELFLFNGSGGAIGLVTTSRPVSSATNFQLNKDFYSALFSRDQRNQYLSIGSVFKATKNARNTGIANRNFALLGDPSMRLGLPEGSAVITSVSNESGQPVVEGLGMVMIQGEIRVGQTRDTDYNGVIRAEIFLPASEPSTLGDENQPFRYQIFDRTLWKGEAQITDGQFSFNIRLPGNLTDVPVEGKIILHATSTEGLADAGGSFSPLAISPVNKPLADTGLPKAQLFVNDSTFLPGGTVNKDPLMLAYFEDDTGIDLTGLNGRQIKLTLDEDSVYTVQDYAVAFQGSGSRTELRFPLFNLTNGRHVAKLSAFDLGGNPVEAFVEFVVNGEEILISEVNGFPNPMTTSTSIRFRHTAPGDDLEGTLAISDPSGRIVREFTFRTFISNAQTEILEWDGTDRDGNRLPAGLYYLRVDVRSLQNGAKNRVFGKLVLLN